MSADITVVIPTSPIPSHPSTEIIDDVIASIRRHLPGSQIRLMCDGIRPELAHRQFQYEEYRRQLADKYNQTNNCIPYFFLEHKHQAGMLKAVIDSIRTPLMFFCEHDATIDDKPIDWNSIRGMLLSAEANTVRLYWHETIHPEHYHLMTGRYGDFVKTIQWSSWPHISRVDFYKQILDAYFSENDKVMTETTLYSPVLEQPWELFRTWIYAPEPDAIRFHHRDGRRDPSTGEKDYGDW